MSPTLHYQFINQPTQLPPLYAALDRCTEIALDTEADNLFRYRTRVCLLQILAAGEIYLVDLLADLPLDGLWTRLAAKPLIMHGSDYDLRLLWEFCRFQPLSLFDTMFAAQLLSIPRFGLAALLEQNFGAHVDKDHQKANWSQRPLDRDMLDYAATDVYYLPELRDRLKAQLTRLGRVDWMEQKCRWQIEVGRAGFAATDENAWRINGSERLRGRGLAVLHALWFWRESWAEAINTPPFKVVGNEMLGRLAGAAEMNIRSKRFCGFIWAAATTGSTPVSWKRSNKAMPPIRKPCRAANGAANFRRCRPPNSPGKIELKPTEIAWPKAYSLIPPSSPLARSSS